MKLEFDPRLGLSKQDWDLISKLTETCPEECSHGGKCILPEGHEDAHDTRYCQWPQEAKS